MPQLDIVTFFTQFFWLCLFFGTFYILCVKYFLPLLSRLFYIRGLKAIVIESIPSADHSSTSFESILWDSLESQQAQLGNLTCFSLPLDVLRWSYITFHATLNGLQVGKILALFKNHQATSAMQEYVTARSITFSLPVIAHEPVFRKLLRIGSCRTIRKSAVINALLSIHGKPKQQDVKSATSKKVPKTSAPALAKESAVESVIKVEKVKKPVVKKPVEKKPKVQKPVAVKVPVEKVPLKQPKAKSKVKK